MSKLFHVNWSSSGSVVLEKKFVVVVVVVLIWSLYKHIQNQFPFLWPHPTPGNHDFNKFDFKLCQKAFV
jgi:hypothetical protein